jgi:hypothetical protein
LEDSNSCVRRYIPIYYIHDYSKHTGNVSLKYTVVIIIINLSFVRHVTQLKLLQLLQSCLFVVRSVITVLRSSFDDCTIAVHTTALSSHYTHFGYFDTTVISHVISDVIIIYRLSCGCITWALTNSACFTDDSAMYTGKCAWYTDVCSSSVLCYSIDQVPAFPCLSINKSNEMLQLVVFCSFQISIYDTLFLKVECFICDFCSKFLIFLLWRVWPYLVLLLEGDVRITNGIISMLVVPTLGSSSVGWLYKCSRRLYIRLLRIFWVIIMFCIVLTLLGIRRLFWWLLGTYFFYLALPKQNDAKGSKIHE